MRDLRVHCPGCGVLIVKHTLPDDLDPVAPRPGDVAICPWCGSMSEYHDDPLTLRPLPADHPAAVDPVLNKISQDVRLRQRLRRVV